MHRDKAHGDFTNSYPDVATLAARISSDEDRRGKLRRMNHIVISEAMLTAINALRSRAWWKFEAISDRMDVEFEELKGNWDDMILELDGHRRMPSGIR
jgi:hypothetical protein